LSGAYRIESTDSSGDVITDEDGNTVYEYYSILNSREEILCDAGFYCEEGTDLPTVCPDGTWSIEGA